MFKFRKRHHAPVEFVEEEARELGREYSRFQKFSNENSLLMGVLVLGIAALVVINTLFWVKWTSDAVRSDASYVATKAARHRVTSQEVAANDVMSVRVKNVTTNSDADPAFGVPEGETMLIMDISITNTSGLTQQLIPVNQLYVRSSEGDYSALHASSKVGTPIASQDVAPGATVSGQISFSVPKRVVSPMLYIDTMWNQATPLVIDVLK